MGFFEPSVIGGGGGGGGGEVPHHYFAIIAPMVIKFGTEMRLDVFYSTMATKQTVISLVLRNYDVITCILADALAQILNTSNSHTPSLIWLKFGI